MIDDSSSALDQLAAELGITAAEPAFPDADPTDAMPEQSELENFPAAEPGEALSGDAIQNFLRMLGDEEMLDLANLSPATLESWQRRMAEGDLQGHDLETVATVAYDEGLHQHFVKAVAAVQSAGEYGDLAVDHTDPMSRVWLEPDTGALTDHSRDWLGSDDPLAGKLRDEWGAGAHDNLGAALKLFFSGAIPRELLHAFDNAAIEEQEAGMRLLAKVATRLKQE